MAAQQLLACFVDEAPPCRDWVIGSPCDADDRDRGAVPREVGDGVERPPGGARAVVADEDRAGPRRHQWLIVPFGFPTFSSPT
jgi:hypothetical protein